MSDEPPIKLRCPPHLGTLVPFRQAIVFDPPKNNMEAQDLISDTIVRTDQDYDRFVEVSMPLLFARASAYTKKLLKETNSWSDNVNHEKLAIRLGYELLERFLVYARSEVPCRPILLLDSFVAKHFSQPTSFVHEYTPQTSLETFIDGLTARAVTSRDALIAQFTHFYSLTPSQVIKLLGLAEEQSQRIYKNYTRWRQSGWHRTMKEIGMTISQVTSLEQELLVNANKVNDDARVFLEKIQAHYRKSEPDHYPCQTQEQWSEMFENGYGQDYRVWHLSMCHSCLTIGHQLVQDEVSGAEPLQFKLQVQPVNSIPLTVNDNQAGMTRHGT